MTLNEYFAKKGSRFSDKDAGVIGPVLATKDRWTAAEVVEKARHKKSPLHSYFEWNNSVAAEHYREVQAREMLRSVTIEVKTVTGVPRRERAFLPVAPTAEEIEAGQTMRTYVPVHIIQKSPDLSRQVMQEAQRQLAAWQKKCDDYIDLLPFYSEGFKRISEELGKTADLLAA